MPEQPSPQECRDILQAHEAFTEAVAEVFLKAASCESPNQALDLLKAAVVGQDHFANLSPKAGEFLRQSYYNVGTILSDRT